MVITQSSGSSANGVAAGLFAAINNPPGKSANGEAGNPLAGDSPATQIDLSPEALERLENDRAAAEKLAAAVAGDNEADATKAPEDRSKDIGFDELFDIAQQNIPVRKQSEDGVLKALPDEQFLASMKEVTQKFWTGIIERKNPEAAAAFKEALANGTARIRLASDVPGADARTEVTYFDNGQGMRTGKTGSNSPEIQAELDAGRALQVWKHGVGDLYITW